MSLELKKLQAELARVVAARMEQEVKVEELTLALERVHKEIEIQSAREAELADRIQASGR